MLKHFFFWIFGVTNISMDIELFNSCCSGTCTFRKKDCKKHAVVLRIHKTSCIFSGMGEIYQERTHMYICMHRHTCQNWHLTKFWCGIPSFFLNPGYGNTVVIPNTTQFVEYWAAKGCRFEAQCGWSYSFFLFCARMPSTSFSNGEVASY